MVVSYAYDWLSIYPPTVRLSVRPPPAVRLPTAQNAQNRRVSPSRSRGSTRATAISPLPSAADGEARRFCASLTLTPHYSVRVGVASELSVIIGCPISGCQ